LKLWKILGAFKLVLQIAERDTQTIGDGWEVFVNEHGIIAEKQDAEGRIVVHKHAAIAVQHAAARRDDRNGANAIAFGHLRVFVGINDLEFPEAEEQQSDHAYNEVGGDGQSGLRQPIVVAKPVRHENPARECFFVQAVKRTALSSGLFVARPARDRDMLASRKNLQRGFRNIRRKLFSKKESKNFPGAPESLPDLCCVHTAESI
jgi:hypothetical protein